MAQPSTAITRWDLALNYSQFNLRMNQKGFVGLKIFPMIMVGLQNANFLKVKIASWLEKIEDLKRAPKGEYKSSDFEYDTDSYSTDDHGTEEPLDDRMVKIYAGLINAEMMARNRAINRVLQSYEYDAITAAQSTSNFSNGAVNTIWSNHPSAIPVDDVMAAIEVVELASGTTPRSMTMGRKTFRNLKQCSQVIDRVKYAGFTNPTMPEAEAVKALCELFEMDNINIASSFKNTADRGQAATLGRFWDPAKVLIHTSSDGGGDLEDPVPRIGNTLCWSEESAGSDGDLMAMIVEEYRHEPTRGTRIRARGDWGLKQMHDECGYLLTGAV